MVVFVHHGFFGVEILNEGNAFFQGLDDFFVIEPVRGRIHHALPVGDGNASPLPHELYKVRFFSCRCSACPLGANGGTMFQELFQNLTLPRCKGREHGVLALLLHERFVAFERLLDLKRVVGGQFCRGIDCGQATADDDCGKENLEIGQRIALEGSRQLERHQKV